MKCIMYNEIDNSMQLLLIISSLMLIILIFASTCNAVGVRPLVLDMDMEPGQIKEFELKISPEKKQQIVEFNLYHPRQHLSGSLSYEKANPDQHVAASWIDIREEVVVPPREEVIVNGKIKIPYNAKGSHTTVIMVEPVVEKPEGGVAFKVRYAVRVNINIERPGLRRKVEVKDFKLQSNDKGRPLITTNIVNNSSLHFKASGEVTVRDENRRLVDRIQIKSDYARQAGRKETKIYSGSKVKFTGEISEVLHPGTYNVRLFLYYADGKQEIRSKKIKVGDQYVKEGQIDYIELNPTYIKDNIRAGGVSTQVVKVRNRTGKDLKIKIGALKIKPNYKHSIFEEFKVELRGKNKINLEPRRSGRTIVLMRSPRDIKPGGYYGRLQIGVFNKEGKKLETRKVDMGMLVGKDWDNNVEIKGISSNKDKKKYFFSVSVKNKGPAHLSPTARVYLKDDKGEIIHTLRVKLPEGRERILPDMSGHLVTTREDIEPGNYTAEITVMYKGKKISTAEYPILITGEKGDDSI